MAAPLPVDSLMSWSLALSRNWLSAEMKLMSATAKRVVMERNRLTNVILDLMLRKTGWCKTR